MANNSVYNEDAMDFAVILIESFCILKMPGQKKL